MAVLLASLALLVFVSGTTTALTGIRRVQSRRLPSTDGEEAEQFEALVASYRSSLVFLHLVASTATVASATLLAADLSDGRWWAITAGGIIAGLLIILVETPARAQAAKAPESFMDALALPLSVLVTLTRPITQLVPFSAEAAFTHPSETDEESGPLEGAKELKEMVKELEDTPEIHEDERQMIQAVLALKETTVKEIMVPQPDFAAVGNDSSLQEVVSLIVESGHSRIPLYAKTRDNIVGVIYAKDVLRQMLAPDKITDLRDIARDPYFVPEGKKVSELLGELQDKNIHFALVVDEYGGVEGLVTLNDVLAEIVGEIEGEFEVPDEPIRVLGGGEALVDGGVLVEEVNEALDMELKEDGFDTIGGYVLHHFGRIPKAGDKLEADSVFIEVLATMGRRIKKLRVRKLEPSPTEARSAS